MYNFKYIIFLQLLLNTFYNGTAQMCSKEVYVRKTQQTMSYYYPYTETEVYIMAIKIYIN